jgi:hypothetical protein
LRAGAISGFAKDFYGGTFEPCACERGGVSGVSATYFSLHEARLQETQASLRLPSQEFP